MTAQDEKRWVCTCGNSTKPEHLKDPATAPKCNTHPYPFRGMGPPMTLMRVFGATGPNVDGLHMEPVLGEDDDL